MAKEEEKFEIEDIKDPLDEVEKGDDKEEVTKEPQEEKPEAVDIEEVVEEETEAPEVKEEAAVAEEVVVEEEKPKKVKKEKPVKEKKPKKPFPKKTVAIVLITFLVTVALVLGGFYLYQQYRAPKEEAKTEETAVAEEQSTEEETEKVVKSVYVNAEPSLNLRKEPSASAEKIGTIPYGTKINVLEVQGSWYKTTYNGLTGWVDSGYTQATSPLVYTNTKYGFQITMPATWAGYKVKEGGPSEVALFYVELPTTDKNWKDSNADSGYASLVAITVYAKSQYDALKAEGGPLGAPVATKGNYVFLASSAQATPTDLADRFDEIRQVIDSFVAL